LKRSLKTKFVGEHILKLMSYVVFECLACNLLQISPLKLCVEKLRFFLMRSQNAGNAISESQILKMSWGHAHHWPGPPCYLVPAVLGSHLRRSHTILGEGQGKWALWQF
jgi:hypothetical protein